MKVTAQGITSLLAKADMFPVASIQTWQESVTKWVFSHKFTQQQCLCIFLLYSSGMSRLSSQVCFLIIFQFSSVISPKSKLQQKKHKLTPNQTFCWSKMDSCTTQLVGKHLASFSKSLCLNTDSSDLVGHQQGEGVIERQRKKRGRWT